MRYILNNSGYVEEISFTHGIECNNKICIEYTGSVPEGYENLAEWSDNANINAYKIVDGNLTYDSEEDTRLQNLWASQQENNNNDSKSKYDLIFDGALTQIGTNYDLEKPITDYDFLVVSAGADGEYYKNAITIPVADVHYSSSEKYTYGISVNKGGAHYFVGFVFPSANTIRLWDRNSEYWGLGHVTKIYGIKL